MILNETAKRCDKVLRIVNGKNFEKNTCYNCSFLTGPGDGVNDKCEKKHKIVLYVLKFGPVKEAFYHRDNEKWACKDKK